MKKILLFSTALSLLVSFSSCGDNENDEPGRTQAPEILSELSDDYVTVTAVGQGTVKLYNKNSNQEIENPITYMRDFGTTPTRYSLRPSNRGCLQAIPPHGK